MPWFHYDPGKAAKADIGVTRRLADFILRHADRESDIYRKAEELKDRYRQCGQVLLHGYPDYDPTALNISAFDPVTYPSCQCILSVRRTAVFIRSADILWK